MTIADGEVMFEFSKHKRTNDEPALDAGDDRDLIALVNEARDWRDIERATTMARRRAQARRGGRFLLRRADRV